MKIWGPLPPRGGWEGTRPGPPNPPPGVIIDHFKKFNLLTKKKADLDLFIKVYNHILNKEHLTHEGLRKIVANKASMNRGLSQKLIKAFPNIIPSQRLLVKNPQVIDPY